MYIKVKFKFVITNSIVIEPQPEVRCGNNWHIVKNMKVQDNMKHIEIFFSVN